MHSPSPCRDPDKKHCSATKFIGRAQFLDGWRWKPGRIATISLHQAAGLD